MGAYTYKPRNWKVEVGGTEVQGHPQLKVQSQPRIHETWSQQQKRREKHRDIVKSWSQRYN